METNNNNLNKIAGHPLQTTYWANFRKTWGNQVDETNYGIITFHKVPFLPYKIGIFEKCPEPTRAMLQELKNLAKKENAIFIKLEPNFSPSSNQLINLLRKNGCVAGKTLFTPSTFWIDLTPSEEDLMKSFHPKTRYNIRLATKRGVEVREDNSDKAFERYLALTRETTQRQGFYAHSEKYHRLMWKTLHTDMVAKGEKPIAHLLTARYKGKIITTWVLFAWKNFLYYPYGASTDEYKEVMANNLMMWEAIKFGKSLGLTTFDLWGREPGKGFTKFKEGYSPKVVEFLGSWDLIVSPLYWPYRLAESLRWHILRPLAKLGFSKHRF